MSTYISVCCSSKTGTCSLRIFKWISYFFKQVHILREWNYGYKECFFYFFNYFFNMFWNCSTHRMILILQFKYMYMYVIATVVIDSFHIVMRVDSCQCICMFVVQSGLVVGSVWSGGWKLFGVISKLLVCLNENIHKLYYYKYLYLYDAAKVLEYQKHYIFQ